MRWPSRWSSWWPWLPPGHGDVEAIVTVVLLVIIFAVGIIIGPRYLKNWSPAGFGPSWRCTYLPGSEPVCVKK